MLIAISRELGACGTEIAVKVATALGIPLVHHEIADLVSSRWDVPREAVLDLKTFRPSDLKMFRSRSSAVHGVAYVSSEVLTLAAPGSVVFRGWSAAQLLSSVPHALCVRICAPFKLRVERMQERVSQGKALVKRMVQENDALRARLVREYHDCDWRDPEGYDLSINTGRLPVDDAVAQIVAQARAPAFRKSSGSAQIMENLRLEALARATLYRNPATRDVRVHVKVSGDELIVGGILNDGAQREEVIRVLSSSALGRSVTSRLRAPTDYRTRTSSI